VRVVSNRWSELTKCIFCFALSALFSGSSVFVQAQQPTKIPRIGLLSNLSASNTTAWEQAFRQGLSERGWIEGKNISIEYRYSRGRNERLRALAAELVHLKVDVIVTSISPETEAAKNATKEIPIVMASVGDPVGSGFVASLAHPGGNVTGLTNLAPQLSGKRLELLKETVPNLKRVAVIWDPDTPISSLALRKPCASTCARFGALLYGST
jgi:putative ABC transport system substrate-binding protein